MSVMEKTYVFGHRKPDTDSVTASIALSYLKNSLGENTEPRVLGNINKETAYALEYFNVESPEYLNDVKLQIKDVNYHKDFILGENESIYNCYQYMLKEGLTGIPIINSSNKFAGLITIKDLSHVFINDNNNTLDTSYDNILQVLEGEELERFDDEIKGHVSVAAYNSDTFKNKANLSSDTILIVGDRKKVLDYAIENKIKLIIITGNCELTKDRIEKAKENKINIITTHLDTFHAAKLISLSNYLRTMIRCYKPTSFDQTDYVDDVLDINDKLRHTNYPVVNRENECLGLLRITDLNGKNPKKVILVDHSEKLQSVEGLDEAEIQEIVDHHNLGNITTNSPINFRNMPVGSTCTIITTLYNERNIEIPKKIAGMLLSGILSDTLILKSPTATDLDKKAVLQLEKIAEVKYEEYGMDLLKAGTSLEGMSIEDVLYNDYKLYTINDKTFAVAQFFTMNFEDIKKDMDKYLEVINEVSEANNYSLVALYVTDIIKNGSYVLFNNKGKNIIDLCYGKSIEEGEFIEHCVSRKKNVIPLIMDVIGD